MIKLHDFAASANCFKVRMLLAQLEIPYERIPVDIFAGESQTREYLARNPAGRTPLLETEDGVAALSALERGLEGRSSLHGRGFASPDNRVPATYGRRWSVEAPPRPYRAT